MGGRYASDDDLAEVAEAIAEAEAEETGAQTPEEPAPPDEGDEGTPEGEEEVGEESPDDSEAEPEDQEPEEPTDERTFTVKVGGQDVEVPESELVKGYMRQDDYTRKTQLLASQRHQLEDANQLVLALERNPQATLKVLARHYQVDEFVPDEGPTPEQIRLAQLERLAQENVVRQREAAVNSELDRLHRDYGEFDEEALFGFAVERGVQDLETALRAMTFGRTATTRRTEKRQMAAVAGGGSRNGTAKPKAPPERISSFTDAYEAAKRELDMGN